MSPALLEFTAWSSVYYWLAFVFSFWVCMKIPSKMDRFDNISGSVLVAMFGFVLWPFFLVAYVRWTRRAKS